jgi:hypothetical protein
MRSPKRITLIILSVVAMELTMLALPALAGSFSWTCQFTHRCVSRTWSTPNTGTHRVTKTNSDCPGVGNEMRVRLVKENLFGDTFYAWKLWDCGTVDQTRGWASTQTGDFHFDIEKNDTDSTFYAWTVYGNTSYP